MGNMKNNCNFARSQPLKRARSRNFSKFQTLYREAKKKYEEICGNIYMFRVFPPGLYSIQNSKIPNTPLPPPDFLGTQQIFQKFPAGSLLHNPINPMQEYFRASSLALRLTKIPSSAPLFRLWNLKRFRSLLFLQTQLLAKHRANRGLSCHSSNVPSIQALGIGKIPSSLLGSGTEKILGSPAPSRTVHRRSELRSGT